jgi:hypothetical protein
LNVVTTVPVVATVVGGTVVNASFAGVPPLTAIAPLEAAVIVSFVVSVAIRMQLPVWLMDKALKTAAPAFPEVSGTLSVPPRVQVEPIWIVSVPEPMTLPYWSSVDTLNVVRTTPAPAVVGGAVVNASLLAVVGVTVVAGVLVTVPPAVLSVAVIVQLVPVVNATPGKLAELEVAGWVRVPVNTHPEEGAIVMESDAPPPEPTKTTGSNVAPATVVDGGCVENERVALAAAGKTPTSVTPASMSAVPSPTPMSDFDKDLRPTPLRLTIFIERLL